VKVISAYSIKAGVGKTAAAVNLAYLSALEGARTLLWDLDQQGSATHFLGHESGLPRDVLDRGKRMIFGDSELGDAVTGARYPNLDLLPADIRGGKVDAYLDQRNRRAQRRLNALLAPLAADYDCVVLDCPPGISVLSESVFYASDLLLVPIIPTTLSVRAFDLLTKYVSEEQRKDRVRDIAVTAFFSMFDRRKQRHNSFVELLPAERAGLLGCVVPAASEVERMSVNRAPVHTYALGSWAAAAYEDLWHEGRLRMGKQLVWHELGWRGIDLRSRVSHLPRQWHWSKIAGADHPVGQPRVSIRIISPTSAQSVFPDRPIRRAERFATSNFCRGIRGPQVRRAPSPTKASASEVCSPAPTETAVAPLGPRHRRLA
jgi:chromosome partitioning protein